MADEAFFKKDKKKGLAALLLLFVGGSQRDKLLVMIAVIAAIVATSVAGLTGRLNLGGGAKKTITTADGVVVAEEEETTAKALEPEQVFQEAKQAGIEAANARKVFGGVPGKARGDKNEAVNYVDRDKKVFGDAEDQHGIEDATEGRKYEGASLAGGSNRNGLAGMQGMGSLGMASAGPNGAMGGNSSFSVSNDKGETFGKLKNKMGDMPTPREPRGGGVGAKGKGGGKLSVSRAKDLNARIVRNNKKVNLKQGKMGKAMWHLVNAAAMTLVSRCAGCAKESTLLYNRAYATGESIQGAGIIALPGDTPVSVDPDKMDRFLNSFAGNTAAIGDGALKCKEASVKNNEDIQKLGKDLGNIKWHGGPLAKTPSRCCRTHNYNSKVDEYRNICGNLNKKTEEVNLACDMKPDQGKWNCSQYGHVHECGELECWLMAIVLVIVIIVLIVITVVTWGSSAWITGPLIAGAAGALGSLLGELGVFGGKDD